jgi:signal peptidase II
MIFAVVAAGGLLLDQLTKIIAVRFLDPVDPPVLLGGLLTLRLIRNPGAAFSLGEGFTIVFALLAVTVLAFVLVKLAPKIGHPGWAVALGLLVAGVSGNLMDRIFRTPGFLHGHVVDFFQLPHFAIFNVADICITSAAVLIMILAVIKNVGIDGVHYARTPAPTGDTRDGDTGRDSDSDTEDATERPERET